ncbi:MAG: 4Fe-4S binding protein [Candidatus Omnitrophica bacterium]|nr:4Fe-4S binding protein [Candidatus Omnitrophota bacterium]
MKKLIFLRRVSQGFFLLLFIYILWSTTYPLTGLLPPETFFKTNPSIMLFTSISERVLLAGLIFAGLMLVLTFIFGRFYCGWVCPLGTMIDVTGALKKRKYIPDNGLNSRIRKGKFIILGVIFIFALAGIQLAWVLDPMTIVARFVSLNLIPTVTLLIDRTFVLIIRNFELYGGFYDLYRGLKTTFLGVNVHYFSNSLIIFAVFAAVCGGSLFISRLWCRSVCPLGAFYALVARFSLLRRVVDKCTDCGVCVEMCRTGAITGAASYNSGECILCMDCIYSCPQKTTRFSFIKRQKAQEGDDREEGRGLSRKSFLFLLLTSIFALGYKRRNPNMKKGAGPVIRPPAALKEKDFNDRCIRCGNCMKVCPTNGLQPVMLQAGVESLWTPALVPEIGYCEYQCTLCGSVCPTGAITELSHSRKLTIKLGTAMVDRSICLPWNHKSDCIVCEEHCPVPDKAIKVTEERHNGKIFKKPFVDPTLCVGCGICQAKCPVRPDRAIRVDPSTADRL